MYLTVVVENNILGIFNSSRVKLSSKKIGLNHTQHLCLEM